MSYNLLEKLEDPGSEIDPRFTDQTHLLGEINNVEDINEYYQNKFETLLRNVKNLEDPDYKPNPNYIFHIAHKIIHNVDLSNICMTGGAISTSIHKGDSYEDPIHSQDIDLFYFGESKLSVRRFKQLVSDLSKIFNIIYYIKYCNIINIYILENGKIWVIQLIDKFGRSIMTPNNQGEEFYSTALEIVGSFDIECLMTYVENKKIMVPKKVFTYVRHGCFASKRYLDMDITTRKRQSQYKNGHILNDIYAMYRLNKYLTRGFNYHIKQGWHIDNSGKILCDDWKTDFQQNITNKYLLPNGEEHILDIPLLEITNPEKREYSEIMMFKEFIIKFLTKHFVKGEFGELLTNFDIRSTFEEEVVITASIRKKFFNILYGNKLEDVIDCVLPVDAVQEMMKSDKELIKKLNDEKPLMKLPVPEERVVVSEDRPVISFSRYN